MKRLSKAQRESLALLAESPRDTAARTWGRFISGLSAKSLCRLGLAETFLPPDGIRKVRITDAGRDALAAHPTEAM
jgi:hypothetical protein